MAVRASMGSACFHEAPPNAALSACLGNIPIGAPTVADRPHRGRYSEINFIGFYAQTLKIFDAVQVRLSGRYFS